MRKLLPILAFLLTAVPSRAQTVEEQMRAMKAEIDSLRAEVNALKEEVRGTVPIVQAQVKEFSQTKVESASKFPVKFFGTIASNTFWNSNDTDWLEIPNIATSRSGGSFSSSLRQTRVGASVDGPEIGAFKTSGVVSMDFFGGISNFSTGQTMGIPRLLYAYMRLDAEKTSFEIGQDQMILAPKNPTSLAAMSFPALYRSGNLYLRVPQLRVEQRLMSGSLGELHATAGILAPVGGDLVAPALQFNPPNLAGERSKTPAAQARISWRSTPAGPYEKPQFEFGGSAHYSREKYSGQYDESLAWSFDADATKGIFGFGAEFFSGRNIDAFGGSIAQFAKSRGGFAEARLALDQQWSLNGGYGTDRLHQAGQFATAQRSNSGAFLNTIYQFTPEFSGALEYRRQSTVSTSANKVRNNHVNFTFAYSF